MSRINDLAPIQNKDAKGDTSKDYTKYLRPKKKKREILHIIIYRNRQLQIKKERNFIIKRINKTPNHSK